jgi:hypothetical protein
MAGCTVKYIEIFEVDEKISKDAKKRKQTEVCQLGRKRGRDLLC